MSERQREFVTAIIKIVFTVIFGGMAGGRLFNLELSTLNYAMGTLSLIVLFIFGLIISRGK